jgi:hypothetical protein
MNDLIDSADNVLLLHPLNPEQGVAFPPAVDPVTEPNGARGVVVAQIFAVKEKSVDEFARQAETTFTSYRALALARPAS